jgi:inorganic pyrophosphatase
MNGINAVNAENIEDIEVDVHVNVSKNENVKYEYDNTLMALICDTIFSTPLKNDYNLGFIPNTIGINEKPLDVVLYMDTKLIPGCYIRCKFLGLLETIDDTGYNPKLIMCPCKKVSYKYKKYNDITDIRDAKLANIKYYFEHYKDSENVQVQIGRWLNKNEAIETYMASQVQDMD